MPTVVQYNGLKFFFWSNEGNPLEPLHIHVGRKISPNATKFWITSNGEVVLASDSRTLSSKEKRLAKMVIEANIGIIYQAWCDYFNQKPSFLR